MHNTVRPLFQWESWGRIRRREVEELHTHTSRETIVRPRATNITDRHFEREWYFFVCRVRWKSAKAASAPWGPPAVTKWGPVVVGGSPAAIITGMIQWGCAGVSVTPESTSTPITLYWPFVYIPTWRFIGHATGVRARWIYYRTRDHRSHHHHHEHAFVPRRWMKASTILFSLGLISNYRVSYIS